MPRLVFVAIVKEVTWI